MARLYTVRVWVETEVLADTPEDAERMALEWAVGQMHTPQARLETVDRMKAACFGCRPATRDRATELMEEHERKMSRKP